MTSQMLESRSSDDPLHHHRRAAAAAACVDHLDDLLSEPVSSVLAAYRQHTSAAAPYWSSGDVIVTSHGVGGAGYGPAGLVSAWPTVPPSRIGADRLSELGAGGYRSHMIGGGGVPAAAAALSAYAGGIDLKPWTANGYVRSPPSAVSPPFSALSPLTGTGRSSQFRTLYHNLQ